MLLRYSVSCQIVNQVMLLQLACLFLLKAMMLPKGVKECSCKKLFAKIMRPNRDGNLQLVLFLIVDLKPWLESILVEFRCASFFILG